MQTLYEKSKINLPRLKRYMLRTVGDELSRLVEPCHYPAVKKHFYEILAAVGLKEKDIKDFRNRFYVGIGPKAGLLVREIQTNLLIFSMYAALKKRDKVLFQTILTYMGIRYYSNLMHRQIPYCNPDLFKYALEHLTKTHLFAREKTIPSTIMFLSKEMAKKHTPFIQEADPDKIADFILAYRHRLSQSIKSFASLYYHAAKTGVAIKKPYEPEEGMEDPAELQKMEKAGRVIDQIVKKITVYKTVDKKAVDEAKKLTKVSAVLAQQIANTVIDLKYADDIKMILQLYLKNVTSVKQICGRDYYNYVKKLMAVKRLGNRVSFKQVVGDTLMKIAVDLNYVDRYDRFTTQTKFVINLYLAYYITMVLRNSVC